MLREVYHPNAYLSDLRNIKLGLKARTKILDFLEKRFPVDAKTIARETKLHYNVVIHHLKLLETEKIVERSGGRPYFWKLTGLGQRRLNSIIKKV
ncbi:hypothetical protein CW708_01980 [Candidatus Bathyarchaeota archaeon]|nr:MAG: hypothetical protein CW708_01980 [Candidatus Bathyarchaeota archaeon]